MRIKQIMSGDAISGTINDVLGIESSYNDKLYIEDGELVYVEDKISSKEKQWLEKLEIYAKYSGEAILMARDTSKAFWQDEYRTKITNIYFKKGKTSVPSNAIDLGNISANSDCSEIRAYLQEEGTKLTIISRYTIYANRMMSKYFEGFENLNSIDFSNFDTSKSTSMAGMFRKCIKLEELDVSNFDTSKTENMIAMFQECKKLTTIDVSNFDTSNVTNMYCMFYGCSSLQSLDVSNFNTSKVTNMGYMFRECISLTELNLRNFDTSNVIDMAIMFYGCSSLQSLDVTSFNTIKVTNMGLMFLNCAKLDKLYFGKNWTTENATTTNMFAGCKATIYYYSENEPTDEGNYWHYVDNEIVEW